MDAERLQEAARNLARIGCLRAYIPEPVGTAWPRADEFQRGILEGHIREVPDLIPALEGAYWTALGRRE